MELTWKKVVNIAACAIAAIAAYTFFTEPVGTQKPSESKRSPNPPAQKQKTNPKANLKANLRSSAKLSSSQDQIKAKEEVKEEAKEEPPVPEKLTKEKFLEINDEIYKKTKANLSQLKQTFSKERREAKDEDEKYRKCAEDYLTNEQNIVKASAEEVLVEKDISHDIYQQAETEFGQDHAAIAQKSAFIRSLSHSDNVPEALTAELLKEIIQAEIDFTETLSVNEEDPLSKILAHAKIEDFIYEKYNFEMADINAAKEKHQAEVKGLWRQAVRKYRALKIF